MMRNDLTSRTHTHTHTPYTSVVCNQVDVHPRDKCSNHIHSQTHYTVIQLFKCTLKPENQIKVHTHGLVATEINISHLVKVFSPVIELCILNSYSFQYSLSTVKPVQNSHIANLYKKVTSLKQPPNNVPKRTSFL